MTEARTGVMRLPREERMAQIYEAATEEFRAVGFEHASMAKIAQRAGIVEGSIYRYFASKADLLIKVIERWYEEMLADYGAQLDKIEGTRERLRFMIWRHLKTVHDDPEMCRLMFDQVRASADYRDTTVYRLNSIYTSKTLQIVREGIARGELRPGLSLQVVRDVIYGGVEHRVWGFLRGEKSFDPEATADAIVTLVLGGIGQPDSSGDRLAAISSRLQALNPDVRGGDHVRA